MVYEQVVRYCNKTGMSIVKFEKLCDLGNGTVGKWKDNKMAPSIKTLNKMSMATRIPITYWIGGDV